MKTVIMADFGTSLSTRASGRCAYDAIREASSGFSEPVKFDFAGVDTVTNSFADELFGRMAYDFGMDELRSITSFANAKRFIAVVIRNAMEARNSQREKVTA